MTSQKLDDSTEHNTVNNKRKKVSFTNMKYTIKGISRQRGKLERKGEYFDNL